MNIRRGFDEHDLKLLIAAADEKKGPHILWVDLEGSVHLDPVPKGASKLEQLRMPRMRFGFAPNAGGQTLVGPRAAKNVKWIEQLYSELIKAWREDRTGFFELFEQ